MAAKKIITVFGATGRQGGGMARAVLADPDSGFTVRAVTRHPDSAPARELARLGVPHRLVTDSMVGALMSRGRVDGVVVGSDRIVANGDFANKIGTYTVAVLAHRHGVPFYVAAPRSTIDPATAVGADIPIEERDGREVTALAGTRIAPPETVGFNLAFDVTPAELVTAIITEVGVLEPPFGESIARALAAGAGGE